MKISWLKLTFLAAAFSVRLFAADLSSGTVIGWGADTALGISTESQKATGTVAIAGQVLTDAVAVSAGENHSLALNKGGAVAAWGGMMSYSPWTGPSDLKNVTAISAGLDFSLALKDDGTVVAWGDNQVGQTNVPLGLSNVVAIAAGWKHGLAVRKDGTVVGWGGYGRTDADRGKAELPPGLSNVVAIAASKGWGGLDAALKSDGTVVAWDNRTAEAEALSGLSNVVAIAVGGVHLLALKKDGTVFGYGNREATSSPPLGDSYGSSGLVMIGGQVLSNVVAVAAGKRFSMALKRDGKVIAWGNPMWQTTDVPAGLSNVVAIAAGGSFCLAITTNSAVAESFRQK